MKNVIVFCVAAGACVFLWSTYQPVKVPSSVEEVKQKVHEETVMVMDPINIVVKKAKAAMPAVSSVPSVPDSMQPPCGSGSMNKAKCVLPWR